MNALTPYSGPPAHVTGPDQERQLPHNLEAEMALLGGLLARNNAYDDVAEFLKPEHFFDPVHGRVYTAIAKLVEQGKAANPVTLKDLFDQDGGLAEVGGAKYLVQLAQAVVTTIKLDDYGRVIVDHAKRRAIIAAADIARAEAFIIDQEVTVDQQIGLIETKMTEIQGMGLVGREATFIGPAMARAIERVQTAFQNGVKHTGIRSGIQALDRRIIGFQPGNLILIAARPSMGKTALGESIARHVSIHGDQVMFFSMEMTEDELAERQIARETSISVERQRSGDVGGLTDFEIMLRAQASMDKVPFIIDDTPALSITQLRARARRAVRQHGIKLIVIDYLGLMKASQARRNGSRNEDVSEISAGLKALAKELRIPVVALSQLSRANESRDEKRPQLSDLRDSGSLEQDADVVIFVHREEYYLERLVPKRKPGEDGNKFSARLADWNAAMDDAMGKAELIVAKIRQGKIGIAECAFDGPRTLFKDIPEPERFI